MYGWAGGKWSRIKKEGHLDGHCVVRAWEEKSLHNIGLCRHIPFLSKNTVEVGVAVPTAPFLLDI